MRITRTIRSETHRRNSIQRPALACLMLGMAAVAGSSFGDCDAYRHDDGVADDAVGWPFASDVWWANVYAVDPARPVVTGISTTFSPISWDAGIYPGDPFEAFLFGSNDDVPHHTDTLLAHAQGVVQESAWGSLSAVPQTVPVGDVAVGDFAFIWVMIKATTYRPNSDTAGGFPAPWDSQASDGHAWFSVASPGTFDPASFGLSPSQSYDDPPVYEFPEGAFLLRAETNRAPLADAGPDKSVGEGTTAQLDGTPSSDPDGTSLTYHWTQITGQPVALNTSDPTKPSFIAPQVDDNGATFTFELVVSDGCASSAPDLVNVAVTNVNHPPVPDAGPDQTVSEGTLVTLEGTNSYDPDLETLAYQWVQTGGPVVPLSDEYAADPFFFAPAVGSTGEILEFTLFITDGIDLAFDVVLVHVTDVNQAPIADAGSVQAVDEATLVTLDATGSSDPDGDALSYAWTQTAGPTVGLDLTDPAMPTFVAPDVAYGTSELLTFKLVVDDGNLFSAPSFVNVTVNGVGSPPDCSVAEARIVGDDGALSRSNLMWPPNHTLHEVRIVGVSDPENLDVTIEILQVTQDEPLNGEDDGNTDEDAIVQTDGRLLLRAERSGSGNGRVYAVHFRATNADGAFCDGIVHVVVPLGKRSVAVDDGPLWVSWTD